jgi:hypothetical protein
LLPSFATVSTPVSLISFEKMLRKSNTAAYENHTEYWKSQRAIPLLISAFYACDPGTVALPLPF